MKLLVDTLCGLGAQVVEGSALRGDRGCTVDVRLSDPACGAITRLRLDHEDRGGRRRDGSMDMCCDFLVAWTAGQGCLLSVFEMKSGTIPRKAVDQLQAALDLVAEIDARPEIRPQRGYLVGGTQTHQLQHYLRTKKRQELRFRGRRIPIEVIRCGTAVVLRQATGAGRRQPAATGRAGVRRGGRSRRSR